MNCPRCKTKLLHTRVGKICIECGTLVDPKAAQAIIITPHSDLVHSEHRLKDPTEHGTGQVDVPTDHNAFTADSNSTFGAFTWIQVAVSRFSYYATVFVLVIIASGLSYGIFVRHPNERAQVSCGTDISRSSSDPAAAGVVSPSPSPLCNK